MFDHIFQITLESHSAYDQLQGLDLGFQQWATRRISRIIGGLENRYDAVLISQKVPDWLPGEHMPTCAVFQVGVCVNINALEVVQRFDPLSDTESAFDALWGEKSELRRFADGAIVKSVLFDCDGTTHQKTMVFPRMAAYLISKHLGSPETSYWCGLGLKFLKPPGLVGSHTFQPVLEAFQSVRKVLVAFKELPLSVASVHGLSSVLSQSSVFVPVPRANEYSPVTTIDALIVFESSNRWPDNLQAIQVMKRAFFVRICQLYNALGQGRAHVELGSNETIFDSGALVLDHLGYTFRFKIHHNREELLLQRLIDTSAPFAHRAAQAVYMETYHMIPYHTSLMGVLTSRFPYLGVSIRLLKRWASAHMLVTDGCSAGINTYVLELLCASVYLKPAPYAVPLSGFTGFLRVLDQMVRWDFNIEPLIVELESGKMTPQMVLEINDKHAQLKKGGHGHIGVYIATERDLGATWWAMQTTSLKIFDKLRVTAHASLSYLSSNLKHGLGPAVDVTMINHRLCFCQTHRITTLLFISTRRLSLSSAII